MKRTKRLLVSLSAIFALLSGSSVGVFAGGETMAQDKEKEKTKARQERRVIVEQEHIRIGQEGVRGHMPPPPHVPGAMGHGGDTFVFVSTEMSFGGKVVKGAPYSAEAVTEFTQTLPDGNRIVRKNSATVYRDSEGRTRRDQTLGAIGPFAVAGDPSQTFFINDPVAKVNYILDPRSRTARKLPLPPGLPPLPFKRGVPGEKEKFHVRIMPPAGVPAPPPPPAAGEGSGGVRVIVDDSLQNEGDVDVVEVAQAESMGATIETRPMRKPQKESLGTRTIEGVEAEGTRITHTIPAGEIGNEQPINIVAESWYSPELQTVVMSRNSDPRVGENVYRLTNINRSEPARTLFEVPADYTIKDSRHNVRFIDKKKNNDK